MKPILVPAILTSSFAEVRDAVDQVADLVSYIQIDVVDGVHAPSVSWPCTGSVSDELALLNGVPIDYELDLMVHHPERMVDLLLGTEASRFIIHLTSTDSLVPLTRRIQGAGREVYVGVVIGDDLSGIDAVADVLDGVQCMGIKNIGKQGEVYDERVLTLIHHVHRRYPSLPVAVDGGVSVHTLPQLIESGVSQFAVGSALFHGDVDQNFLDLMRCIESC